MTQQIYNPIKFMQILEIFTISIIGTFVSWKFLNTIYESIYEPTFDIMINAKKNDIYYLKIGHYYVQISAIIKEFIKWIVVIVILMFIYNIITKHKSSPS